MKSSLKKANLKSLLYFYVVFLVKNNIHNLKYVMKNIVIGNLARIASYSWFTSLAFSVILNIATIGVSSYLLLYFFAHLSLMNWFTSQFTDNKVDREILKAISEEITDNIKNTKNTLVRVLVVFFKLHTQSVVSIGNLILKLFNTNKRKIITLAVLLTLLISSLFVPVSGSIVNTIYCNAPPSTILSYIFLPIELLGTFMYKSFFSDNVWAFLPNRTSKLLTNIAGWNKLKNALNTKAIYFTIAFANTTSVCITYFQNRKDEILYENEKNEDLPVIYLKEYTDALSLKNVISPLAFLRTLFFNTDNTQEPVYSNGEIYRYGEVIKTPVKKL